VCELCQAASRSWQPTQQKSAACDIPRPRHKTATIQSAVKWISFCEAALRPLAFSFAPGGNCAPLCLSPSYATATGQRPSRAARRGAALKRGRAPPASDAISPAPINHRYPEERTLGPTESAAVPWPGRRPRPRSLGGRQSPRAARPELLCSRPGRAGPRPSRRGSRTRLDRLVRKRSDVHVNGHRDYFSRRLYSGRVPISTWASPETNRVKFGVEKSTETGRLHAWGSGGSINLHLPRVRSQRYYTVEKVGHRIETKCTKDEHYGLLQRVVRYRPNDTACWNFTYCSSNAAILCNKNFVNFFHFKLSCKFVTNITLQSCRVLNVLRLEYWVLHCGIVRQFWRPVYNNVCISTSSDNSTKTYKGRLFRLLLKFFLYLYFTKKLA